MRQAPSTTEGVLPRWAVIAGSVVILFHLTAIVVPILDSPSGPWASPMGRTVDDPPPFAHALTGLTDWHAQFLRIGGNYHFIFNRPGDAPAVEMEVRLKDDKGAVRTLKFPDPQANPWVRHRQALLVMALAPDLPVQPGGQEIIAAPGQKAPTSTVWVTADDRIADGSPPAGPTDPAIQLRLRTVPQHLVPRGRDVMRPSDWSVVLAKSYARKLSRDYGAASVEIIRHTREPVSPALLFQGGSPDDKFDELLASFGEVSPR